MLNEAKTEATVFCAPCCKAPPNVDTINVCGHDITPVICERHRRLHGQHFEYVDASRSHMCKTIVHVLVTSRLDYGNAVLFGVNVRLIQKLQMVQNSAARLITQQRRHDHQHIMLTLIALHWLPVRCRIN